MGKTLLPSGTAPMKLVIGRHITLSSILDESGHYQSLRDTVIADMTQGRDEGEGGVKAIVVPTA
jgi:hypothetical protein